MAQPFGVGDVVGGRYRITHHVVTSADQDIVFQATDEVLDRDISILLASRANAKQVATSAKELATGERDSAVQVMDLGLAEDRTYLISNQVDPNLLLDLVVPDAAPYVEPFFTDSLGQEIFGQSRVMEPETYEDDLEYYARLHDGLNEDTGTEQPEEDGKPRRRRPAFLDKVSDSLNKRLGTDRDADRIRPASPGQQAEGPAAAASGVGAGVGAGAGGALGALTLQSDMELVEVSPAADGQESFEAATDPSEPFSSRADAAGAAAAAGVAAEGAAAAKASQDAPEGGTSEEQDGEVVEAMPSVPLDTVAAQATSSGSPATQPQEAEDELDDGEEVVDDPPEEPVAEYDQRPAPTPADAAGLSGDRESEALAGLKSLGSQERDGGRNALGATEDASSFTGVISAVPPQTRSAFPAASGAEKAAAEEPLTVAAGEAGAGADAGGLGESGAGGAGAGADFQDEKPTPRRWLGIISLAAIIAVIAVAAFFVLTDGEPDETAQEGSAEDEQSPEAEEPQDGEEGAQQGEEPAEEDTPVPAVAAVTRSVPDSADLGADNDADLSAIHDGDTATTWNPGSYGTASFGNFASTMYLVMELEESAPVSAVTVTQEGETSGGTFEVLVNDQPNTDGAETVGSGSFEWTETTVELDEGAEGQYVLIAIDELPQHTPPQVAGLPYTLNLAEISVE